MAVWFAKGVACRTSTWVNKDAFLQGDGHGILRVAFLGVPLCIPACGSANLVHILLLPAPDIFSMFLAVQFYPRFRPLNRTLSVGGIPEFRSIASALLAGVTTPVTFVLVAMKVVERLFRLAFGADLYGSIVN